MSRRRHVMMQSGAINRESMDLTRQLNNIMFQYKFGQITLTQAKLKAERVIQRHYDSLLALTKTRIRYALGPGGELSPEHKQQLERWKQDAIDNFNVILDDIH